MLSIVPFDTLEIGVDEVGRGCLWGPVYAAAVLLPEIDVDDCGMWAEMKDSKQISKKKRERLADFIKQNALAYGVGVVSAGDIDKKNILQASLDAMHKALDAAWVQHSFKLIAVDGIHFTPYITPPTRFTDEPESIDAVCIAQGDNSRISIAAASILAKVERDRWVESYLAAHPELEPYGLKTNMGYGTPAHIAALKKHGVQELHRMTFRPVSDLIGVGVGDAAKQSAAAADS